MHFIRHKNHFIGKHAIILYSNNETFDKNNNMSTTVDLQDLVWFDSFDDFAAQKYSLADVRHDFTSPGPSSTPPGSSSASRMCSPNRGGRAKPEKSFIICKRQNLVTSLESYQSVKTIQLNCSLVNYIHVAAKWRRPHTSAFGWHQHPPWRWSPCKSIRRCATVLTPLFVEQASSWSHSLCH